MCATIPWAMCWPATSAPAVSMCSTRWAGTPSGCRPKTPRWSARRIPATWTYANIDAMKHQLKSMGLAIDWTREFATCNPSYYRHQQRLFLDMYGEGPRVPPVEQGQLGSGRPHRAGQRAGHRRPRLAVGRARRAARADAVGVQDHRIRRRPARSAGHARQMAGKSPPHAGELDRPLGRLAGSLGAGRSDRAEGRDGAGSVHDAPGHALRRLVHGDRARSSAGACGGRDQSRRRGLQRGMPAHGHVGRRASRARKRKASIPASSPSIRSIRRGNCRSMSPTSS